MLKRASIAVFCAALLVMEAGADELGVAREALRDGLWEIARSHAAKAEGDEAKLIVLESLAKEAKWDDLLAAASDWGEIAGDGFVYYRALALEELGRYEEAARLLDSGTVSDPRYRQLSVRLRARIALASGDAPSALKILQETGFDAADDDSRMEAADIRKAAGDLAGAERIWRAVASGTNVGERVFTLAAINLGDRELLERAYRQARIPALRRQAAIRYGLALLAAPENFDEGAELIRTQVKDSPDTEGAKDAFLRLADCQLSSGRFEEAAEAFAFALETWPDTAFVAAVQEGRGWALRKLGKVKEAVEALSKAEEVAKTDADRARLALELGDCLSELGRGDEAMANYRLVLEKYPSTEAGERLKVKMRLRELENRGRDLLRDCQFDEAMKVFAELAALAPERKSRSDYYEMLCLFGGRRDDAVRKKAREILSEAAADPQVRAETTFWLAKFEYNSRKWAESRRLFAEYAEMEPQSPKAPSALTWAARAAFAANDFSAAIEAVSNLVERYPTSPERLGGYIVQAESLVELSRFDEAVLVLDRAALVEGAPAEERLRAQVLKADALFAMGADNADRYREALEAYRVVRLGEALSEDLKIVVSGKIARTLEKLKRSDEAFEMYYADVLTAYRKGRLSGVRYDDETRAAFSRSAFHLADEYERRGRDAAAVAVLELVAKSDVPAAGEAVKRIARIQAKGSPQ